MDPMNRSITYTKLNSASPQEIAFGKSDAPAKRMEKSLYRQYI